MPTFYQTSPQSRPRIAQHTIIFGADPEFFFTQNGEVVGSEKILNTQHSPGTPLSKIIVDGVQAEINPHP